MPTSSKVFTGFRALGFISSHVPLVVRYNQKLKENFVVTCVGKSFHVYNCSKLGIVNVSNAQAEDIQCSAVDGIHVYTAAGKEIYAFARGKQVVHTYSGHQKSVNLLLPFGNHLISVDEDSVVHVWDIHSEELFLEMQFDNKDFQVTSIVHPSTYVNKVLFGSKQGTLQLWNLRTNKLIHTFYGWGEHITVLQQAPAVDVVAVGLADGRIILHNLRYDETIVKFTQDWGPVTAITFRTDGHPIMATGSNMGHIALWNLEEKRLQSQIREAHDGSVSGMQCLPSEPLLVTSSSDNSLKIWIFDQSDGGGRLLRQRSGHSAPPTKIRYHGNDGQNILSAGQDSTLRSFSTLHDRHSKSLGRASYNKAASRRSGLKHDQHRMPPVVDFASESSRQSDWDSIIACHRGLTVTTTWNYHKSTMGSHKLQHERFNKEKHKHVTATSVDITSCGNFCVIGYSSGHVDVFNMQSGIHRGSYGNPTAHKGAVRGVAVDGLNQLTVSAGADCCVNFWRFKSKQLLQSVKLEAQAACCQLHRGSSMLAVALDDFSVHVIDVDTRKLVRKFSGHKNMITDMAFSPDGRWLFTASMDSTVRLCDLPTARLVDCFLVDEAVTSLTMSPSGDFLATTHVDNLGVYLWSNMTLYTHVSLSPLPDDFEPQLMQMPSTGSCSLDAEEITEEEVDAYENMEFKSPDQLSNELVTLSLVPNSRWQNLLQLDIIRQRNKPRQPPKVPKAAPFFLPTIAGLEPKFAPIEEDQTEEAASRVLTGALQELSKFGKLLLNSGKDGKYKEVMNFLKEAGPSTIDVEIRNLAPEGGGSVELMAHFMGFISATLQTNKDFELAQAYLGVFLQVHGDTISSEPVLLEQLQSLQQCQKEAWQRLQGHFNQSICLVNYLKSAML